MATVPEGLKTSLNKLREVSSDIFHQYMPIITDTTSISEYASPLLENPNLMNEFVETLLQRIVYTSFEIKYFRNPLKPLEGDRIPLGYAGQEVYVNPAKGRRFNVNDFAGLLYKYESDTKVQYMVVNSDLQYPVTISRHKLKQAFVSWDALDTYIDEITSSLYNGAYIDEYRFTKALVSSAYSQGAVQTEVISAPTTEALAKEFITKARADFLNFQLPSTNFNAWSKVGGSGKPITTWSNPEDIVFLIKNDLRAYIDVNVLASAFNMDKTDLVGRIITVDSFDEYDDDGNKIFDGSKIIGMIADSSWFRIKEQDMYMDEFYNANNRTWQYYLNVTKMYQFSLFANAKVYATEEPEVLVKDIVFKMGNETFSGSQQLQKTTILQASTQAELDELLKPVEIEIIKKPNQAEGEVEITVNQNESSTYEIVERDGKKYLIVTPNPIAIADLNDFGGANFDAMVYFGSPNNPEAFRNIFLGWITAK